MRDRGEGGKEKGRRRGGEGRGWEGRWEMGGGRRYDMIPRGKREEKEV